jgi:hypothetical protein
MCQEQIQPCIANNIQQFVRFTSFCCKSEHVDESLCYAGGPDYSEVTRNLALELVRVTEAAALAGAGWLGKGNKNAADQASAQHPLSWRA